MSLSHWRSASLIIGSLTACVAPPIAAQTLGVPRYQPGNARTRAAQMIDSVSSLDRSAGAVRRVLVDTAIAGAFWLEFNPVAMARVTLAPTPQAAAVTFLESHASKVFRLGAPGVALKQTTTSTDGSVTHFRYQQTHAGYAVLGAQLTLHVAKVEGGYAIQSANGWLVPDAQRVSVPRLGAPDAEIAAAEAPARPQRASSRTPATNALSGRAFSPSGPFRARYNTTTRSVIPYPNLLDVSVLTL